MHHTVVELLANPLGMQHMSSYMAIEYALDYGRIFEHRLCIYLQYESILEVFSFTGPINLSLCQDFPLH